MAGTNRLRSILSKLPRVSSDTDTATEDAEGAIDDESVEGGATAHSERGGGEERLSAASKEATPTASSGGFVVPPADELVTPESPDVIRSTADPSQLDDDDPSVVAVLDRVQSFFEKEIKEDGPFLGAWLSAFMDNRQLAEPITKRGDEMFVMVEGERLVELGEAIDVSSGAMRVVRDVHAGYAEVNGLVEYTLAMGVLCIEVPEGKSLTEDELAIPGLLRGDVPERDVA